MEQTQSFSVGYLRQTSSLFVSESAFYLYAYTCGYTHIYKTKNTAICIGEILLSKTYVAGHILLINSLDWTDTGISFILLTVNL